MVRGSAISIFAAVYLLFFISPCLVQSSCFYPNGDTASDRIPCNNDGSTSVCCAKNFYCLSNGLCVDNRYENFQRVLRGSCTNKGGGGPCPKYCTSQWPQGDEAIYYCGNGKYCCTNRECCSKGEGLMDLGEPQVTATAGVGGNVARPATKETPKPAAQPQPQPSQQPQQPQEPQQPQKPPESQQPQQTQQAPQTQSAPQQTQVQQPPQQQEQQQQPTSTTRTSNDSEDDTPNPSSLQPSSTSRDPSSEEDSSMFSTLSTSSSSESVSTTETTFQNRPSSPATVTVSLSLTPSASTTTTSSLTLPSSPKKDINWPVIGVGVGVGIGLLIFLVILAAFLFVRRYKKKSAQRAAEKGTNTPSQNESDQTQPRDVEALVELEGDLKLIEMASEREKGELDGTMLEEIAQRNRIIAGLIHRETSLRSESSDHTNSDVETPELDRQSNLTEICSPCTVIPRASPWTNLTNRNSV